MYKLCVDIGGTFTDFILIEVESGQIWSTKILSTPGEADRAVIEGTRRLLQESGISARNIDAVMHATTLVTNAIIERKGAVTALLTTDGFRDILEIGNERGYDIYDIQIEMPPPLVPRELRREVDERLGPDGEVLRPLAIERTRQILHELRDEFGIEAIAVSLLHAYLNAEHEEQLARLIAAELPDVAVSLSSQVLPELREYPRTSTTVANAYVQPVMRRYLERLETRLAAEGMRGPLHVMLSDGGLTSADTATRFPVRLVESGPAAGVLAARSYGRLSNQDDLLAFDMGGTTAKASVILDGKLTHTTDFEAARLHWERQGSGLPLRVPVTDLIEIGAGGGSLASINALGLLQVGPQSAGADPGPVCYGRGGTRPTVTDADLVLGYLNPDFFLGGEIALDKAGAEEAIRTQIAEPLGISVTKAALGIHEVINEQMAQAAQIHLIERGLDVRDFALIAFGGAGPVHAYGLASRLNLSRVIYPPLAGVASAVGIAWAPALFSLVRSLPASLSEIGLSDVRQRYEEMEREALEIMAGVGLEPEDVTFLRSCDARYKGQGYEIEVDLPNGPFDERLLQALQANFATAYRHFYHREVPDVELEVLTWRLVASGPEPSPRLPRKEQAATVSVKGYRLALFSGLDDFVETPVYDRYQLAPGTSLQGPSIIEERESTVIVGPGALVHVDEMSNLHVQLSTSDRPQAEVRLLGREVVR